MAGVGAAGWAWAASAVGNAGVLAAPCRRGPAALLVVPEATGVTRGKSGRS